MNEILEAFSLAEENKNNEAYEKFTSLLDNSKFAIEARYSRAMLDISKIKKYTENTIQDLKYLINKKTKYSKICYSFLTLLYDELDDIDNIIKFARLAIKVSTPFEKEINFALARALARTNSNDNLVEALSIINEFLENDEDSEQMSYLICKCDILISLHYFSEARSSIDRLVTNFGHSGMTYYLKARLGIIEYRNTNEKLLLDEVINCATIALQYEEDDSSKEILVEAFTSKKDYNKALEILDSLKNANNEEDIIMEKIKIYDDAKEYHQGLDLIKKYLDNNESWKVKYMEGAFTLEIDSSDNGKKYAIDCFKEAYKLYHSTAIVYDIIKINRSLNNEEDNFNYLSQLPEKDGILYYYLAESSFRLGKEYEIINEFYYRSYKCGYLEENEYYDSICNYVLNPEKLYKIIKKMEKRNLNSNFVWSKRKTAIRYIYKEDGYKQNLKKAKKIIDNCIDDFENDPCTLSLSGRCNELMNKPKLAYEQYEAAYQAISQIGEVDCDCAYGYLAHAYIEGIGTKQNFEKAKELIIKAIDISGIFTCSHVAYYYAYFYLMGDQNFDGNFAKKLLENNYSFYRYDISRIVLLNQVCKKLHSNSKKLKDLLEMINIYSKEDIKYFNENIDKDISKPFWRNI